MSDAISDGDAASASLLDNEDAQRGALLMVAAPLIAMAGTWVVKKTLDAGYKRVTGHAPPKAADSRAPLTRVLVWSLATAVAVAVVNVAVDRWIMPDPGSAPPA